jgi:hypothetical protein
LEAITFLITETTNHHSCVCLYIYIYILYIYIYIHTYIYPYTGIHKSIYELTGQDVSLLQAIIKPSLLRNFLALFTNNLLISSYDVLCDGRDFFLTVVISFIERLLKEKAWWLLVVSCKLSSNRFIFGIFYDCIYVYMINRTTWINLFKIT